MPGSVGLLLKRLLLAFWAMYFSMVALTNLIDLLGQLGALHWTFLDSGNFAYLRSVVKVYGVGRDVTKVLLAGAWLIAVVGAILFWRALAASGPGGGGSRRTFEALCWGVLVWLSFTFMTEFFVAYPAESVFRELLVLMIATAVALVVIPDEVSRPPGSAAGRGRSRRDGESAREARRAPGQQ
jgi:hypothetical protein